MGQSDIVTQKTNTEIKVIYAKQIFHYNIFILHATDFFMFATVCPRLMYNVLNK
jgi:hypothetical protein